MTPTEARALLWPEMYIAESLPPSSQVYLCDEADAIIRSLADQVEALQSELCNIAEARRHNRLYFDNDTAFADWAQSRASFAIYRAREET